MGLYRTRTYIAADFDHDKDIVDELIKWNNSNHWGLSFSNAHDLESCRDTSLYCTIKDSLRMRMNGSKQFILIVGNHTASLSKGGCQYCQSYNSYTQHCAKGKSIDYMSYIDFECDLAIKANIPIIILYKGATINKNLCPKSVRNIGKSISTYYYQNKGKYWNYQTIKDAIMYSNK